MPGPFRSTPLALQSLQQQLLGRLVISLFEVNPAPILWVRRWDEKRWREGTCPLPDSVLVVGLGASPGLSGVGLLSLGFTAV